MKSGQRLAVSLNPSNIESKGFRVSLHALTTMWKADEGTYPWCPRDIPHIIAILILYPSFLH